MLCVRKYKLLMQYCLLIFFDIVYCSLVVGEERIRLQPHALEDPQVQHLIKVSSNYNLIYVLYCLRH